MLIIMLFVISSCDRISSVQQEVSQGETCPAPIVSQRHLKIASSNATRT